MPAQATTQDSIWKTLKAKKTGDMVQAIDHLPSESKVLSSSSSIIFKKTISY
jgi:hypothetical protein